MLKKEAYDFGFAATNGIIKMVAAQVDNLSGHEKVDLSLSALGKVTSDFFVQVQDEPNEHELRKEFCRAIVQAGQIAYNDGMLQSRAMLEIIMTAKKEGIEMPVIGIHRIPENESASFPPNVSQLIGEHDPMNKVARALHRIADELARTNDGIEKAGEMFEPFMMKIISQVAAPEENENTSAFPPDYAQQINRNNLVHVVCEKCGINMMLPRESFEELPVCGACGATIHADPDEKKN